MEWLGVVSETVNAFFEFKFVFVRTPFVRTKFLAPAFTDLLELVSGGLIDGFAAAEVDVLVVDSVLLAIGPVPLKHGFCSRPIK